MNKKGFTLVELLAVIVIIAMLGVITIPNVLEYFNESKIKAIVIQENKLIESGDILIDDYCDSPVDDTYKSKCDNYFQSYVDINDQLIIEDDLYTKYICIKDLKELNYYSEKLKFSGNDCSGVVIYKKNSENDLTSDSFSVIKCGEEYISDVEDAQSYVTKFSECFDGNVIENETNQKYLLMVNFTEFNPYGQSVSSAYNSKHNVGENISINVPSYFDGDNNYIPYIHTSSNDNGLFNITGNVLSGKMPNKDVEINIVYDIRQYTVTFNYIDGVTGSNLIGGNTYQSKEYKVFNGQRIDIPYMNINNFKIISHNNGNDKIFVLNDHSDKNIDIKYQQRFFNLLYNENNGSICENTRSEYGLSYGELCVIDRVGYQFKSWNYENDVISDSLSGEGRFKSSKVNNNYHDIEFDAIWENNTYNISYNCNGGIPNDSYSSSHVYDVSSKLIKNRCSKVGFSFSKWSLSGGIEPYYSDEEDVVNLTTTNLGNVNLYANYSPNYVTVVYHPKDATVIKFKGNDKTVSQFENETSSTIYYNQSYADGLANIQNPNWIYLERQGYLPTGNWYAGSYKLNQDVSYIGSEFAQTFGVLEQLKTGNVRIDLYPEWIKASHKILVINGPNGVLTTDKAEASPDELINLTISPNIGYIYKGSTISYKDSNGVDKTMNLSGDAKSFNMLSSDIVITPIFEVAELKKLTYNYNYSKTYATNEYDDTRYKINWDNDFELSATINFATPGKRYLIFGSYNNGDSRALNVEVNAENKLRVYFGTGGHNFASGKVANNEDVKVVFVWDAETDTYTITATGETTNISFSNKYSITKNASYWLRIGARDHRSASNVFNPITIKSFSFSTYKYQGEELGSLIFPYRKGLSFNGWFTSSEGGSLVSESTKMPLDDTTYYAHWDNNLYTITVKTATGGSIVVNSDTTKNITSAYAGEKITIKDTVVSKYVYAGSNMKYLSNGNIKYLDVNELSFYMPASNIEITPGFLKVTGNDYFQYDLTNSYESNSGYVRIEYEVAYDSARNRSIIRFIKGNKNYRLGTNQEMYIYVHTYITVTALDSGKKAYSTMHVQGDHAANAYELWSATPSPQTLTVYHNDTLGPKKISISAETEYADPYPSSGSGSNSITTGTHE